jgi:hypothetical protein
VRKLSWWQLALLGLAAPVLFGLAWYATREPARCSRFEPCLKHEDDPADPAHNFTCALLCVRCGKPREAHDS